MHRANGLTKQEVLARIKLNGPMTADALSNYLGISPVAARQHLSALEAEGYVITFSEKQQRGRPVHVYNLTARGDETFPRAYDTLANSLLEELRSSQGDDAVDALFAARRRRLRAAFELRIEGKPLTDRVREIARMRCENGNMTVVEQDGDDLIMIEHNCIISRISRSNPCACVHDFGLLCDLCGDQATIVREKHMAAGDNSCTYRVTPRERPATS